MKSINEYSGRILVVDDDNVCRHLWRGILSSYGFRVFTATNLEEMEELLLEHSIDLVLLDIQLGNENGLDALPIISVKSPYSKVFILTAHATVDSAIEAMNNGVDGYIKKDEYPESVAKRIVKSLDLPSNNPLKSLSPEELASVGLIGESDSFRALCEDIYQLRDVDSTVLILGESGTGKEVVARALHRFSNRGSRTFAAINCAAVPEALLESELFGHKKGAFTDAKSSRVGIFEMCTDGTLLLDEIGDMPLNLQVKLLRVLQEETVVPVGSSIPIKINTRVIAATHRNLIEEIKNGGFREDLYYRLSVIPLTVPPLRDRKTDIPILCEYYIKQMNAKFNKNVKFPDQDIYRQLQEYDWPGNIRELRNAIERSVVMSRDNKLHIEDIFNHHPNRKLISNSQEKSWIPDEVLKVDMTEAKKAFMIQYITAQLRMTEGNITKTSMNTGRYRADLYRLLDKYSIDHSRFKKTPD